MPHLTRRVTRRSPGGARTGERLGLGIPGYAHPLVAPAEWAELARPGLPLRWATLNVSNGPGTGPDPYCLNAVARLRSAGVGVLGHLDLARGGRPRADVVGAARCYADWYRVGGFLLDRCATGPAALQGVRRTAEALRDAVPGARLVLWLGRPPAPGYAEIADETVTFAGSWDEYRRSQVPNGPAVRPDGASAGRFGHMVYGVPRGRLQAALRIARRQGASTVFVTDRTPLTGRASGSSPWDALPGYWDDLVSLVGRRGSE